MCPWLDNKNVNAEYSGLEYTDPQTRATAVEGKYASIHQLVSIPFHVSSELSTTNESEILG